MKIPNIHISVISFFLAIAIIMTIIKVRYIYSTLNINSVGVLLGIGAGFTYALVTIISEAIINVYHQLTIILYRFLFGWIFLVPFSNPLDFLYVKI